MDHRSANGLFNTADDLLAVSGIGPAKVEQI
jgi:DNA uptake protein ComE-like DNA-binding protein